MKKQSRVIYFLTLHFLVFVVYNLGHPVTSSFIKNIKGPAYLQGLLLGVMALGGFFFAPLWGQVAKRFGSKVIILGPIGYAVGQLGFVLLSFWPGLVLLRFVAGIFASINGTLHFVHLTHLSETKKARTKNLGFAALLLTAAGGVGYILGGYIGEGNPRLTFVVQIIASLVLAVLLYLELHKEDGDHSVTINYNFFKQNMMILKKYRHRGLHYIILLTILNVIGNSILILSSLLPQLDRLFNFSSGQQGIGYGVTIFLATLCSYSFVKRILVKVKKHQRLLLVLAIIATLSGVIAMPLLHLLGTVGWIYLLCLFVIITVMNTIFVTIVQEILSDMAIENEHSQLTGLNHSAQSLAVFIGSFTGGLLFAVNPYLPLYVGSSCFICIVCYNTFLWKTGKLA